MTKIEYVILLTYRVLDLSYNNIKKIEGLSTLKNVHTLYLTSNKIKVIENLDDLYENLISLELGCNKIS
jgi:protein phosphatase 1 regulatory subunit 7